MRIEDCCYSTASKHFNCPDLQSRSTRLEVLINVINCEGYCVNILSASSVQREIWGV